MRASNQRTCSSVCRSPIDSDSTDILILAQEESGHCRGAGSSILEGGCEFGVSAASGAEGCLPCDEFIQLAIVLQQSCTSQGIGDML